MKIKTLAAVGAVVALSAMYASADPLGTAFTYQGRLTASGNPAQGIYDLRFAIYDVASGGSPVAGPLTNSSVTVSNGLFTVALDFGPGVFNGNAGWLEIAVRTNGTAAFTPLFPRQPLTPAPYALFTASAAAATAAASVAANGVANASLQANAVTSDKIADGTITAADLSPALVSNTFWRLSGNSSTTPGAQFLGTSDNQALELRVNGGRALRLEPNATGPNVLGGSAGNTVANGAGAAVIGGGANNRVTDNFGTVGGGLQNQAGDDDSSTSYGSYATVAGGVQNVASGFAATVGGGNGNTNAGWYAIIGGGTYNAVQASYATVAGGSGNVIPVGEYSTIGGGRNNYADGFVSTVAGGWNNTNIGFTATIAGGNLNLIEADYATISGGLSNSVLAYPGGDGERATIAGGTMNTAAGYLSSIGGGELNFISDGGDRAVIGGGSSNTNIAYVATIAGGVYNFAGGQYATISGGGGNVATGFCATVCGGLNNTANGSYSLAAGRRAKANHSGAFVWADSANADFASSGSNQFLLRASGGVGIGTNSPSAQLDVAPAVGVRGLQVIGQRAGDWGSSLGWLENVNTAGNSAPALRVASWGACPNGALSVSANGTGLIAQFGNYYSFVANITTNGTFNGLVFNPTCDRAAKEQFTAVAPRQVLEKVAALPLSEWSYKADTSTRHLGPMAQDFHAAFGLGTDDKHIATVDADGVALAAIQGLNLKLEEQLRAKDAELKALKQRLDALEQRFSK